MGQPQRSPQLELCVLAQAVCQLQRHVHPKLFALQLYRRRQLWQERRRKSELPLARIPLNDIRHGSRCTVRLPSLIAPPHTLRHSLHLARIQAADASTAQRRGHHRKGRHHQHLGQQPQRFTRAEPLCRRLVATGPTVEPQRGFQRQPVQHRCQNLYALRPTFGHALADESYPSRQAVLHHDDAICAPHHQLIPRPAHRLLGVYHRQA